MSAPAAEAVSASVEVDASAQEVWRLLTDLDVLAELGEEVQAMRWVRGTSAQPGSAFRGANRNGWRRWSTTCTVTDAEPGRRFAFDVSSGPLPVARWQYDLEPLADDRCRVTESTWDRRPGWFVRPGGWLTGVADRRTTSRAHIEATLARLQERVSG